MIEKLVSIVKGTSVDTLSEVSGLIANILDIFDTKLFKSNFSEEELQNLDVLWSDYSDEVLISYVVSELNKGENND